LGKAFNGRKGDSARGKHFEREEGGAEGTKGGEKGSAVRVRRLYQYW